MDIGNVDAIDFTFGGKKHIRTYYQTNDKKIRETSYEAEKGWFVRENTVIATNARANSPITATHWFKDNKVHIRVYFLDESRKICERAGEHTASGTGWRSGNPLQLHGNKETNVAEASQLAVARPDKDYETLRVFYQEPKTTDNKYPIREVRYKKNTDRWTLQDSKILDAAENSRLSAVSAGKAWNVRFYYQAADGNWLRVCHWNSDQGQWNISQNVPGQYKLAPSAPIVATCWYASETNDTDDLRVRIYTILDSDKSKIVEVARNGGEWEDEVPLTTILASTPATTSIGVTRERVSNDEAPIFVFYKPRPSYIDMAFPLVNPAMTEAAKDDFRPRGIPTSR